MTSKTDKQEDKDMTNLVEKAMKALLLTLLFFSFEGCSKLKKTAEGENMDPTEVLQEETDFVIDGEDSENFLAEDKETALEESKDEAALAQSSQEEGKAQEEEMASFARGDPSVG